MSCPHVSALAVIVKSVHPSWSPAAIKSFDYGSGHVNPVAAIDPGLIYDFDTTDIINFLCSTGASPAQLKNLTGEITNCSRSNISPNDFNYPSIGVSNLNGNLSVQRTVTYYGKGPTAYKASVDYPVGVNVSVTPNELRFEKTGDKMSFKINFTPYKTSNGEYVFGTLRWTNGIHVVRSPIGLNVVSV